MVHANGFSLSLTANYKDFTIKSNNCEKYI